jgi:hypothetical protein
MGRTFMTGAQALAIARSIAAEHQLFITEQVDVRADGARVTVWILYRKLAEGRRTRLGKRSSPAALLSAVKKAAAVETDARRAA